MNEPTVEIKHGKRDLSVIDIEKTLDRLAVLEKRFALQDDLDNDYYELLITAKATITVLEAELEAADGDAQKLIGTVLKQQKLVTEAKQTIKAVANRLEDEDPSLLALDIKYIINRSKL